MADIAHQLAAISTSAPLPFWVLGSVLAYVLATGVLWLLKSIELRRSLSGRWLEQVGRFLFFLGIPYLALGGWPRRPFHGLLSLEDMGLVGLSQRWPVTRWLEATGTGLALGFFALLILILAWMIAGRGRLCFPPRPWWALLVDVIYLEVHWSFYRGALAVVLGDPYAGVFLGLGLVYVEWGLNPFWREGWRSKSLAAGRWLRAAMALVVALIFLLTRNFWVCLLVHGLIEPAFWQLGRERAPVEGLVLPVSAENAEAVKEIL